MKLRIVALIGSSWFLAVASLATNTTAEPVRSKAPVVATDSRQSPAVEVAWGGSWWRAEILEKRSGLTKIHYTGWGSEWDEWVEPARIRRAPANVALKNAKLGQKVAIEWQGSFWDGQVIAVRSGLFKVHYAGWGSEWDEWVEPSRLRAR